MMTFDLSHEFVKIIPLNPLFNCSPLAPPCDVDDEDDDDGEVDEDADGEDVVPARRGEHALHHRLVEAVPLGAARPLLQLRVAEAALALQ